MATLDLPVVKENVERPEFTTERLHLDPDSARSLVEDSVAGIRATVTEQGIKIRTRDGDLIALLTGTHYEDPAVKLHYRTAPAHVAATLRARSLRRALEPYIE